MSKPTSVVLATFPSSSRPGAVHTVKRGADGVVWCSCPSWRFQHNSPSNRTCKHIENWKAHTVVPGAGGATLLDVLGPGPEAVRPVRRSRTKRVVPSEPVVAHDTVPCPPPAGFLPDEPEWSGADEASLSLHTALEAALRKTA